MLKHSIIIATFIIFFMGTFAMLLGQHHKHSFFVHTGYAIGNPDVRYEFLYDQGPVQTVINKLGNTTKDDEYAVGMVYKHSIHPYINAGFGIGYAQLVQDFFLPADGNGYFMQSILPFFWRDKSHYHMIQLQPSFDLKLLNNSSKLGINCTGISNISFRKHINLFNLSRHKAEFFSSELYTGIYGGYKRFRLDVGYRLLHWKYRDDAISNNGLSVDNYNLPKWRFLLSYEFWRK